MAKVFGFFGFPWNQDDKKMLILSYMGSSLYKYINHQYIISDIS